MCRFHKVLNNADQEAKTCFIEKNTQTNPNLQFLVKPILHLRNCKQLHCRV